MDQRRVPLEKRGRFQGERGVALLIAFSVSFIVLGLIAALYWVSLQRHVLMRRRTARERSFYLTEAGVQDAIARLRIGTSHASGINPVTGGNYCLNVGTGAIQGGVVGACPATCVPEGPNVVRVCIAPPDADGRNVIKVTEIF